MKVIDVIKDTCTYLQMEEELEYVLSYNVDTNKFDLEPNSVDVSKNLNLLLKCVNLVLNTIVSEYVNLKDCTYLVSNNCRIKYEDVTSNNIVKIVSVENDNKKVAFSDFGSEICVEKDDKYKVTYLYTLENVDFSDDVSIIKFPCKSIAYGVASEYLYINKLYDDASVWDVRFKNSMLNLLQNKKHRFIKPRRWF